MPYTRAVSTRLHGRSIARETARNSAGQAQLFDTIAAPAFLLISIALLVVATSTTGLPKEPMVSLPVMDAEPVDKLDNRFLITITTTDIEDQEPGLGHLGASSGGDCRVFFPGGPAVDAAELYDRAFSELDYLSGDQSHPWRYPDGHFEDVVLPTFYIQSDVYTPWRCVAGAIFIIEAAGYPEVGLLTQSSAID